MNSSTVPARKLIKLRSLIVDRFDKATKKMQKITRHNSSENSPSSKKKKQQKRFFPRFNMQAKKFTNKACIGDGDEITSVNTTSMNTVNSTERASSVTNKLCTSKSMNNSESKAKTTVSSSNEDKENTENHKKSQKTKKNVKAIADDDSDAWYASCWQKHQQSPQLQPSKSKEPLAFVPPTLTTTTETMDYTLPPSAIEETKTTKTKNAERRRTPKWVLAKAAPPLKVNCYGHNDDDFILVDLEGEASATPLEASQHKQKSLLGELFVL